MSKKSPFKAIDVLTDLTIYIQTLHHACSEKQVAHERKHKPPSDKFYRERIGYLQALEDIQMQITRIETEKEKGENQ